MTSIIKEIDTNYESTEHDGVEYPLLPADFSYRAQESIAHLWIASEERSDQKMTIDPCRPKQAERNE